VLGGSVTELSVTDNCQERNDGTPIPEPLLNIAQSYKLHESQPRLPSADIIVRNRPRKVVI
jgi:hypothetical protein